MSKPLKIVVADDDEDYRFLFKESLHEAGISATVSFAINGIEVIDLLNTMSSPPDILFLDINMPKMDGLTALEHIRNNELYSKVPIIILSCTEEPDKVEDAYRKGANLFVRKPAGYLEYVSLLHSLLGSEKEAMISESVSEKVNNR
jgi:CheY-like chemotaxis protein